MSNGPLSQSNVQTLALCVVAIAAVVIAVFLFLDWRDDSEAGDSGFRRGLCEESRTSRDPGREC